jgi:hypothetical protein
MSYNGVYVKQEKSQALAIGEHSFFFHFFKKVEQKSRASKVNTAALLIAVGSTAIKYSHSTA